MKLSTHERADWEAAILDGYWIARDGQAYNVGFGHGKDTKFLFRGLGRYEAIRAAISVHKAKV